MEITASLLKIFTSPLFGLISVALLLLIAKLVRQRNERIAISASRSLDFDLPAKKDTDLDWLNPPADPHDIVAWDKHWTEHVRNGIGPQIFDMFFDDQDLIKVMKSELMNTVLCAGNGISQEPRALAHAGFQVVALDLSPRGIEIAQEFGFESEYFEYLCGVDARQPGGHVEFVVGDILDPSVYPGPFDVIIERCTAQLYFNHGIGNILDALAKRLDKNGIFLSHCHDGRWKPPGEPRHFSKFWFQENEWTLWNGSPGRKPSGRVAWLSTSTG